MKDREPSKEPVPDEIVHLATEWQSSLQNHIIFDLKTGGWAGKTEARAKTELLLFSKRLPNASYDVSRTLRNFERDARDKR